MASSYSTRTRFTLQATGENNNTWGNILNAGVFQLMDDSIAGTVAFALSGTHVLTTANGATDEARQAILSITGGTGGTITIPPVSKPYIVRNGASGPVTISMGAGAVAVFQPGETGGCFCDAANVYRVRPTDFGGAQLTGVGAPTTPQGVVNKAYADNLAFNAVGLPGQAGQANKFLGTDGTFATWDFIGGASILPGAIGTQHIANAAITTPLIANGAVMTAQIANGAVTNAQLGAGAVDYTKFSGLALKINGPAGNQRVIQFYSSATVPPPDNPGLRWNLGVNSAAETGASVGSDFSIDRYNDNGAYAGSPIFISRATGGVTFAQPVVVSNGPITISGINPSEKGLNLGTNSVLRWKVVSNAANEAGGNVGSDFALYRYDDTGNFLGTPFVIQRSSGNVTVAQTLSVAGPVYGSSTVSVTNTLYLNAASGAWKAFYIQNAGSVRWAIVSDNVADGSGNTGSGFSIQRYDNSGNYIDSPFSINRSNGWVAINLLTCGNAINAPISPNQAANQVMVGYYAGGSYFNAQSMGIGVSGTSAIAGYSSGSSSNCTWSTTPSDRRLKENVEKPSRDPLDVVRNLPIWSCDFVPKVTAEDPENWPTPREHWPFSFMADEVDAVMPHATIKVDERPVALHPQHLIAVLWAAVQQLEAKVQALEAAH
jgi:hypothetical protein